MHSNVSFKVYVEFHCLKTIKEYLWKQISYHKHIVNQTIDFILCDRILFSLYIVPTFSGKNYGWYQNFLGNLCFICWEFSLQSMLYLLRIFLAIYAFLLRIFLAIYALFVENFLGNLCFICWELSRWSMLYLLRIFLAIYATFAEKFLGNLCIICLTTGYK